MILNKFTEKTKRNSNENFCISYNFDFERDVGFGVPGTKSHNSFLMDTWFKNRISLVQKLVLSIRRNLHVRSLVTLWRFKKKYTHYAFFRDSLIRKIQIWSQLFESSKVVRHQLKKCIHITYLQFPIYTFLLFFFFLFVAIWC